MLGHSQPIPAVLWRSGALAAILWIALWPGDVGADEFFLKNGSRVEGRLLNPHERPRIKYEIRLASGANTSLQADDVLKFVPASPSKRNYLAWLPKMPQTADGNWRMAEWCRKNALSEERTFHLEQTVALDPNHEKAHRALGHMLVGGKWSARDEVMKGRGYVKHKGRWRLPQEVAIEVQQEQNELAEKTWRRNIRSWRKKLQKQWDLEVLQKFESIVDPMAAAALADLLPQEQNRHLRNLYIQVLSDLDSRVATEALIRCALTHEDEDTRELCLEKLPPAGRSAAVSACTVALANKDPRRIEAAGRMLLALKDPEAIPHLIDALVTEHQWRISGGNPGQIGTTFGSSSDGSFSGTGLSTGGGGPKYEVKVIQHRSVLEALLAVTDGVNFQYDELAWRQWFAQAGAPQGLDLRRRD